MLFVISCPYKWIVTMTIDRFGGFGDGRRGRGDHRRKEFQFDGHHAPHKRLPRHAGPGTAQTATGPVAEPPARLHVSGRQRNRLGRRHPRRGYRLGCRGLPPRSFRHRQGRDRTSGVSQTQPSGRISAGYSTVQRNSQHPRPPRQRSNVQIGHQSSGHAGRPAPVALHHQRHSPH